MAQGIPQVMTESRKLEGSHCSLSFFLLWLLSEMRWSTSEIIQINRAHLVYYKSFHILASLIMGSCTQHRACWQQVELSYLKGQKEFLATSWRGSLRGL